jgi:hypothetical protein
MTWTSRRYSVRSGVVYFSLVLALMLLSFGLIQQVSSQSTNQDNLKVLNYSWYFDVAGGFHVVGEVQNVGTTILNPVVLGATIYTPDGTPQIQSTPCQVYVQYMLPQQKAPFLMDFPLIDMSWISQGIAHTDFTVIMANTTSSYQYPDLTITSSALSLDEEGIYWVNGEVRNTGNSTANNVRVIGTFYNATGTVVAAGYSEKLTPANLAPSSSAPFKVGAFDVNKTETEESRQITNYKLMVQTEGPLLSGTPPPVSEFNSTNTQTPSSGDSSSGDNSSNQAALGYTLRYVALIVVIVIVVGSVLAYRRRKSSKLSTEKKTKSPSVGKRQRPSRRGRRNA